MRKREEVILEGIAGLRSQKGRVLCVIIATAVGAEER